MSGTQTALEIDAGGLHYRELNSIVRRAVNAGAAELVLRNVLGQRYIGAGLTSSTRITIEGVPGNDLACFMDGPSIVVRGNAQDGVANTMSSGCVVVHGGAGDVVGYSMRGGRVLIKGSAGYRVGIHMKAYGDRTPLVVVGGTARDYLGEYMAGGTLVVLGLDREDGASPVGELVGTGMHGGEIFIRGGVREWQLGKEVGVVQIDDERWRRLRGHLAEFSGHFGLRMEQLERSDFTMLRPVSLRPYGRIYVY